MLVKWRAECNDCPKTPDIYWGHLVSTACYESPSRTRVDSWVRMHQKSHTARFGKEAEISIYQTTTISVNVESLNPDVLAMLFGRSPQR